MQNIFDMNLQKVTAHRSWHDDDDGEQILNWLGNEWADDLAKKAAMKFAPPQNDLDEATRWLSKGKAYLRGLATLLSRFPLIGETQFELSKTLTRDNLVARVSHEWAWVGHLNEFVCRNCFVYVHKKTSATGKSVCRPAVHDHPLLGKCHPTHRLMVADVDSPLCDEVSSLLVW